MYMIITPVHRSAYGTALSLISGRSGHCRQKSMSALLSLDIIAPSLCYLSSANPEHHTTTYYLHLLMSSHPGPLSIHNHTCQSSPSIYYFIPYRARMAPFKTWCPLLMKKMYYQLGVVVTRCRHLDGLMHTFQVHSRTRVDTDRSVT